jgi:hypothetical protein
VAAAGAVVVMMLAGAVNVGPGVFRFTTGGVWGRGCACTTAALEVVLPPSASCATAVSTYVPAAPGDHDTEYGAVVTREMSVQSA